jgi:hypothetical protein
VFDREEGKLGMRKTKQKAEIRSCASNIFLALIQNPLYPRKLS